MSTETEIRRRWKDTKWWAYEEDTNTDGDLEIEVRGRTGEVFSLGGDISLREKGFLQQSAHAPEDIDVLLTTIDRLRARIANLEAGGIVAEELGLEDTYIFYPSKEEQRQLEILYQAGALTFEQEDLRREGVPQEDWPALDEVFQDFVREWLGVAWDQAQEEADYEKPTNQPPTV